MWSFVPKTLIRILLLFLFASHLSIAQHSVSDLIDHGWEIYYPDTITQKFDPWFLWEGRLASLQDDSVISQIQFPNGNIALFARVGAEVQQRNDFIPEIDVSEDLLSFIKRELDLVGYRANQVISTEKGILIYSFDWNIEKRALIGRRDMIGDSVYSSLTPLLRSKSIDRESYDYGEIEKETLKIPLSWLGNDNTNDWISWIEHEGEKIRTYNDNNLLIWLSYDDRKIWAREFSGTKIGACQRLKNGNFLVYTESDQELDALLVLNNDGEILSVEKNVEHFVTINFNPNGGFVGYRFLPVHGKVINAALYKSGYLVINEAGLVWYFNEASKLQMHSHIVDYQVIGMEVNGKGEVLIWGKQAFDDSYEIHNKLSLFDPDLNLVWEKVIQYDEEYDLETTFFEARFCQDSLIFIATVHSKSDNYRYSEVSMAFPKLILLDINGQLKFEQIIHNRSLNVEQGILLLKSIAPLPDGNVLLFGYVSEEGSTTGGDSWFALFNKYGKVRWVNANRKNDAYEEVITLPDGGNLLFANDFLISKIDPNGNIIWNHNLPLNTGHPFVALLDGGKLLITWNQASEYGEDLHFYCIKSDKIEN